TPPSGHAYVQTGLATLPGGTVLLALMDQDNAGTKCNTFVLRGTPKADGTIGWSSRIPVLSAQHGVDNTCTASVPLPLPDGSVMLGLYGGYTGTGISVVFSSDDGQSFGREVSVVATSGYNESNYQIDP